MAQIALLSGGLGQEINTRSEGKSHPLWSVKVMFDAPHIVEDVHLDYINAGSRVLTLNTYTATPIRMEKHGYGDRLEDAHGAAAHAAFKAIERSGKARRDIQIAGCLPPIVASYVADVSLSFETSLEIFRQLVALQSEVSDVFFIETMSNISETRAGLQAVKEADKQAYVGFTLADDLSNCLRSGEALDDAITAILPLQPDGIMINCSHPEAVSQAMPILAKSGVRFGGYANAFTAIEALKPGSTVDALEARKDITPDVYAAHALAWVNAGATIIGGCCEVGPAHIQHLAKALWDAGHEIVSL